MIPSPHKEVDTEAHIPQIEDQVTEAHIPLIENLSHMIDMIMTPTIPDPQTKIDMIHIMIEDKIGMTDIGIENLKITVIHSMDLEILVPIHNIDPTSGTNIKGWVQLI